MLDEMDANRVIPTSDHRADPRVNCRCSAVIVIVNQSGYESTFLNPVRNISQSGIAFLHRSMLHQGTQCIIRIRTPDQRWLQLGGDVVRSRYIRSMVYEIGLKFGEPLDLDRFKQITE